MAFAHRKIISAFIILQNPFNNLTYSMIGDDAATSVFEINPRTGAISTRPTTNLTQTTGNFVVSPYFQLPPIELTVFIFKKDKIQIVTFF